MIYGREAMWEYITVNYLNKGRSIDQLIKNIAQD